MRVLVTRAQPAAARTAEALRRLGHEAVLLPLTETVSVPVQSGIPGVDAVAVTSANAIQHAPAALISDLADLPWFAVGGQTADFARRAGISDIRQAPDGNVASLISAVNDALPGYASLLYLTGSPRRPDFEEAMAAQSVPLTVVTTYETLARIPSQDEMVSLGSPFDAVLVMSRLTAVALNRVVTDWPELFASSAYLCMSQDIANALVTPDRVIRIAASPDQNALLDLLRAKG